MYSHLHPSIPCFISREAYAALWIYPELMLPTWLAMKNKAPRRLSSERLYQHPRYHWTAGKKRLPDAPMKNRIRYSCCTLLTLY